MRFCATLSAVRTLVFALPLVASCSSAPEAQDETPVRDNLNDNFLADDMSVEEWVDRFEVESREISARKDQIVAALDLRRGDDAADVGAGTGLFLPELSSAVGTDGSVHAVDISPTFLAYLRQRVEDEGMRNVRVVEATELDPGLEPRSLDVIFLCDTYHHLTYPRTSLVAFHTALRPGGSLFIVDFERIPGVSREWVLGHVRTGKQEVISEIEAEGFRFVEELEVGLDENYMIRFSR